jgi:quercetin dioxygenase-like cupin family protein
MEQGETGATRPRGQTEGSRERAARQVSGSAAVFDLGAEVEALQRESSWQQGDRNAKTFLKESGLRVVLTVLKAGAQVKEHRVPGPATVQTLSGRISLRLPDQTVELTAGRLLMLPSDLPHDVEALEESTFLVAIAWPGEPGGDGEAGR